MMVMREKAKKQIIQTTTPTQMLQTGPDTREQQWQDHDINTSVIDINPIVEKLDPRCRTSSCNCEADNDGNPHYLTCNLKYEKNQ